MSQFDILYRRLLLTKYFTKGFGKPEDMKRILEFRKILSNRETCKDLVEKDYPIQIDKDKVYKDCRIMEGHFISPFVKYLPDIAPKTVETARFQMVLPPHWKKSEGLKPICIQLPGTGDNNYRRRKNNMAKPLIKESGIGSILLQNPYYGKRKPSEQKLSSLLYVNDLLIMGLALILECKVLLYWCEREGYGPLGIHGISLGGHMASLAATNWNKPISLIPCLSWSNGSTAYIKGALRNAVDWNVLQSQYYEDSVYLEIQNGIKTSGTSKGANPLDKQFVKDYPDSLKEVIESITQELSVEGPDNSNKDTEVTKSKLSVPKNLSDANNKPQLNCKKDTMEFLQCVLDECTDLSNYSVPVDPRLITVVAAEKDAYIPRDGQVSLEQLWPGAEIRYIKRGHVAAIIFNQTDFRKAIQNSFEQQHKLYYS